MCVVDAYDEGDSGFVMLIVLWKTHFFFVYNP